ncbi:KilA-N domain-containing protein [Pseudomonas sp. K1(2024)]|uniref:KilA-N domain-containing protein n=1 Tax=Pseudomonas boreofloridensis TaxID=3064348 RepID=A0ABV4ZAC7_9PSED|nr:KilA-N domain-containing protein [Pseudomonas sp. K13]MDO7903398.1 KilA-N domain-containing protein [Pseudomonas sp. K13]
MSKIIPFQYDGEPVRFNSDGWIDATDVAKRFGKKPAEWLRLPDTLKYIDALARHLNVGESHLFARSSKGRNGGVQITLFSASSLLASM